MPNYITPQGKWKKEISFNDPYYMADKSQITPEEYQMENGDPITWKNGKPTKEGWVSNLRQAVTNPNVFNNEFQTKLQYQSQFDNRFLKAQDRVFQFISQDGLEMDAAIANWKQQNNIVSTGGGIRNPNMVKKSSLKLFDNLNQNQNEEDLYDEEQYTQSLQAARHQQYVQSQSSVPQINKPKIINSQRIIANREQLKQALNKQNKNQPVTIKNNYKNTSNTIKKAN